MIFTSKITTLEKNRYSILTNDLNHCYICKKPKQHLHEIYYGKNRINSMKYGCVVPLCFRCHNRIHHDCTVDIQLKNKCENKFKEIYPDINFLDIFHRTYI